MFVWTIGDAVALARFRPSECRPSWAWPPVRRLLRIAGNGSGGACNRLGGAFGPRHSFLASRMAIMP
jgi:hypothetical protein